MNSLDVVEKLNKSVRLCLYTRELNKSILRENFPMKTVEEVTAKVKNAKVYSIHYALNRYLQKRLTKVPIFLFEDIHICVNLLVSKAQVRFLQRRPSLKYMKTCTVVR